MPAPLPSRLLLAGLLAGLAVLAAGDLLWLLGFISPAQFATIVTPLLPFLAVLVLGMAARPAAADDPQHLQALLDYLPDRIYFKDLQSRFVRINRALAQRFGLPDAGSIAGMTDADFFSAEFARQTRADECKVIETGCALVGKEERETWPDGRVTWAVTTTMPVRDDAGRIVGLAGLSRDVSKRKQAEAALAEAEEKYRGIFEHAVEGIYQTNVEGRFLTANPKLAQIFGFASPAELVGCGEIANNLLYVEAGRRAEFARRMRAAGAITGFESQIRRRDGVLVWISENARTLYGADGGMVGYEGTVVDVSERQRAEETLRRASDELRTIIEASPIAIFTIDLAANVSSWNPAAERMFGWTAAEVLGRPTPLVPPERQGEFEELLDRLTRGEAFAGVQVQRLRRDGSRIDVSLSAAPLSDAAGKVAGITVLAADITESKRTEQALMRERALLRSLIDSIPDLIFFKDREGRYLGCNAAWSQRTGRAERALIGLRATDLFAPAVSALYLQQDRQVLDQGKPQRFEEWIEYMDGRRILAEVVKTPYFGPDGVSLGLIGVSRDITERKQLEDQLRQAQKMEAVGQLAGGVAHDFNNLLTAILGNVSLLLSSLPDDDANREVLRDTERAAARAAELTGQLLGYSRQTMLHLEPTDLRKAIDDTVALLRRTIDPRIVVEVDSAADLWPVQADPGQMSQVLMNLCLNARDAMPDGGQLRLAAASVVLDAEQARRRLDARAGDFVRLRVGDTGTGIPPEIRARIFDPFFTTKGPGKGTGLGLAMVFGIIKQHQGWIECHSEVGRGTHFDIFLPRTGGTPRPATPPALPEPIVGGCETILVVDDEAVIRNLGRTILQRYGYRVILAEDGLEAVELYRRQAGQIDLVLLDLMMPRLSGRDTLRELLRLDPGVRVLFSSGYSAEQFSDTGNEGVCGFVNKPYRPQDLVRTIRRVLDQVKSEVG